MTNTLPISLVLFTSSKQHFGHKDVYLKTLAHLDRQIPLRLFGARVAHIKVSEADTAFGEQMRGELEARGFTVLTTQADWARGQSHQMGYMADVVKLSKESSIYENPFVLWAEDDQTITSNQCTAENLLLQSCQRLRDDNELVSVRLLRRGDLDSSPMVAREDRWFYSPHVNFQWPLLRSRDFYLASLFIEQNPQAAATIQCEMLWRLILANFSRSERKHLVYLPEYAESIHLGTPEYPALCARLGL